MKKLITNRLFAIIFVFLCATTIFNSCKKDDSLSTTDEKTLVKLKSKTLLTKNAVDLSSRLDVIKSEFYKRKLDANFAPKNENNFIWTPQWSDPKIQTINDSVSYVFYHLKPQAKWDGKMIDVKEIGAVRYIMVKNETEFYEAFFYLPSNLRSKTPNNDTPETFMGKFTGKLLLTNLENKQSFLLDYKDGRVSDTYKRQLLASRKQLAVGGATAYYEVVCTTVTLGCSYEATGLGDGCWEEGWRVTYIPDCSYPTACGDWKLTDRRTTTTCETVWFDDPPTDPTDPNDPGNNGGTGTQPPMPKEINNNIADSCLRSTIAAALLSNNNIKGTISNIINKFDQKDNGLTINLLDTLSVGAATTQIISTSSNTFVLNINFNASHFSNMSKEAVVGALIHEAVHAYLLHTNNNYGSLPVSQQHNYMFQNYIKDMAVYLMSKYGMNRTEAFGMAWHGTDLFENAAFSDEFSAKLDGDATDVKISKSDLHFGFLPYVQDDPTLEQKGTPNCNN